jgi:hypothetical protein
VNGKPLSPKSHGFQRKNVRLIFEIEKHERLCVEADLLHHFFKTYLLIAKLLAGPDSPISA